ncbi:MAG TPA: bifunctional demethylmenaquinone methyltransferase/2-methoxy-6-polyprenyl-1,4-benzoquinol methylase UbiE [Chitinophagaceae bacterium]|jgi:demethylmenaquinone methyltransferase/2-methoxy-6-polyprenyl-1,4-benzoquinol methylase|nr:bifunctional demethylmenaquinone methyltransferase/2-methoxy-6-polyprenyl-1,4-benzoquinol methylase UbiE [Chitinophagaceae bacterium]
MADSLPHDSITPFADSTKTKKEQIAQMFNNIAGCYDRLNRVLSAGADINWRKKAISQLKKDSPKLILDVATGTADMAIIAYHLLKPQKIIGIDISEQMLELGRKKVEKEGLTGVIQLQTDDSETINFADNSFDAVMVAFGVRNFENLEKGLKEMLRVLKSGGKLVVLEFSRPRIKIFRSLYNLYMSIVAPEVARWFSQNKKAYKYLNQSAKLFPDRQEFVDILNNAGYSDTSFKSLSAGICCIYLGKKPVS